MGGLIESSINFGQQNFFFIKDDNTDGTYEYTAYMTHKGAILIARYRKDGTEGLYWLGTGVFSTIWAAKDTLTYVLPNVLISPSI